MMTALSFFLTGVFILACCIGTLTSAVFGMMTIAIGLLIVSMIAFLQKL